MPEPLLTHWRKSPTLVRVVPFILFLLLTFGQGQFGEGSRYWVYLAKTLVGAALIWAVYPWISEMRWKFSWEALVAGVAVFALWVGLDGLYPSLDALIKKVLCPVLGPLGFGDWCSKPATAPSPWNPHQLYAAPMAWVFAVARLLGSTLVVPPLEEVFYRSFLYRYLAKPEFEKLPLGHFAWGPFLITALIFGFAHYEWLPGILCGLIYQALVVRHQRLGDAMTAHAITNLLLGLWVITRGAWHFW
jgi:uncharacterized protein